MRISDWSSDVCSSDLDRSERSRRVAGLLKMVNLPGHYADRRPSQLSGGEKQRVNLARALAADPDVLLCDEITSALDTVVAASIIKLVEQLRDQLNLAIVFISHDMATVAALANDVMVLRNGRVVEKGQIGRAHVGTPVTNDHIECHLL